MVLVLVVMILSKRRGFGSVKTRELKSGARSYLASFINPDTGKRVSRSFRSKMEANAWLGERRRDIRSGEFRTPEEHQEVVTFAHATKEHLERVETAGRKGSTLYTYSSKLRYPLEKLGTKNLGELSCNDIEAYCQQASKDLTPGAATNALNLTRAVLRWAAKRGYMDASQLRQVTWPVFEPVKDPERRQVATPEEVKGFAAAMPDRLRLAVLLGAWCSMRMGEICGLQRADFTNLDNPPLATVRIVRQTNSKMRGAYTDLKTKAGRREISIPPALVPVIKQHLSTWVAKDPKAPVFPRTTDPAKPVHHNTVRSAFERAREQLDMEWFVFHDLRHTGLTTFAQQGATLAELLERGGHVDVEVALRYQHATIERDRKLTAKMDSRIEV
ncbi:tyrosine-type recombinase/integrase [uncultured Varibaculum sp.]|uniref:tyrosine-type recombinase/integrase n=1 Tax=uncultured Varibaculum sp. TaxID=413896 RepID=UPI0028053EFA|nr:tyrosine-type recombinase/integrase [uncultured Varibaculum sp.]